MNQTSVKKPSARKSLRLFTNIFDDNKRTDICCVGDKKSKRRAIKYGCGLWKNLKTEREFKNQ